MLQIHEEKDLCSLKCDSLELQWQFVQDRWQHRVRVGVDGARSLFLESLDSQNLVTPVFQELRLEQPEKDVAEVQLFGQSQRVVYSAAIRLEAAVKRIHFDIAARVSRGLDLTQLLSHYQFCDAQIKSIADDESVYRLGCEDGQSVELDSIWLASGPQSAIRVTEPNSDATQRTLDVGCFDLHLNTRDPGTTVRWCYAVRIV